MTQQKRNELVIDYLIKQVEDRLKQSTQVSISPYMLYM